MIDLWLKKVNINKFHCIEYNIPLYCNKKI